VNVTDLHKIKYEGMYSPTPRKNYCRFCWDCF